MDSEAAQQQLPPAAMRRRGRFHELVQFDPAAGGRSPSADAGGCMKRRYTMDQYRADVAKLHSPWSEAPGVNGALAEALAEGAELLPVEQTPQEAVVQSRPPPPPKAGFVQRWSGLRRRVRRDEP